MQRVSNYEPVGLLRVEPDRGVLLDDRYRLIEGLGQSESGRAFRVHDSRLKRHVVIKQLHSRLAVDPSLRTTFLRAAETMANLHHPNVVTVHDAGGWEAQPYLVMPLEDGMPLDRWVRRREGSLPLDTVKEILDQACAGLGAMHEVGIIHGNLSPSTIVVSDSLGVTLVDPALHPQVGALQDILDPGRGQGFEAPESIRHEEIDAALAPRIDVYSLGMVAYWLLTGQGPGSRSAGISGGLRSGPGVAASELRSDLSPAIDAAIEQALHVDPRQRPCVEEFRAQVLAALEGAAPQTAPFIMVVDDDIETLALSVHVARVAVDHAEVVGVPDPRSALAIMGIRRPDLVVTDLSMPQLSGIEFTAAIRGNQSTESVPVIVVTGVGGADDWKLLHALGAEYLIVKPIRPPMLQDAIRRSLKLN